MASQPAATAAPAKPRRKRARRPAYSAREDTTLCKLFPTQGALACAAKLRRRSPGSIKQRAAILGLKPPPGQGHQGLKRRLSDEQAELGLAMHEGGTSFAKIGAHFGVCEATATNAVRRAECLRGGGTPAKRDSSGAILARDIARLRAMLREGRKGCDIARTLGISANSVSYHRRRYADELKATGSQIVLPVAGQGEVYSGRKLSRKRHLEIADLLMSGLGAARVSQATGASKSQIGRIRRRLVARLGSKGQCLAGCAADGKRLVTLRSARFITPELVAIFRQHLLTRAPVRRAALLTAIGGSTAYRLRDEFRAELHAQGQSLPNPILPGRRSRWYQDDAAWLPSGAIYQFRSFLESADFETAKQQFLDAHSPPVPALLPAAAEPQLSRPPQTSFEKQLAAIRNGAKLIEVRPFGRCVAPITYGGVSSYDG
jgi:transposase-like protein